MEKKTPLLDEIGRKHGMKVPGNYFADFTEKMTESLPEREFPELVQPSLWLPYVAMSQNFMSQTNRLWMEIYQIVKENCSSEYGGATPQDDVMERLLSARKGK